MTVLAKFFADLAKRNYDISRVPAANLHFYSALELVEASSPEVARSIVLELLDQRRNIKLIASENYSSLAVQAAQGNLFTDKYAEGSIGHRFYAGCDNVDAIERHAATLACRLFGAEHAYVQPHSGSDANLIAFISILQSRVQEPLLESLGVKGPQGATREQWNLLREKFFDKKILAMDYYSGGHLTHGYRFNFSSLLFDAYGYSVDKSTHEIDYSALRQTAREIRPLVLLAGYSSYPRKLDFSKFKEIADEVGAVLMVDMAHFAGLVAGKVFTGVYDPVAYADIVTSTTHKTLRGPRGGLVLCKSGLKGVVDKACPSVAGGPLPHVIASKAVALEEALSDEFQRYAHQIVDNARAFAERCASLGLAVLTGGTDNHLVLLDVQTSFGLTGRQAESALRDCGVTLNRNVIPFDSNGPWYTSGLRVGTPAATSLGMGREEMREIADVFHLVLSNTRPLTVDGKPNLAKYAVDDTAQAKARARVGDLLSRHVLYPEIDSGVAAAHFGL
jgi:glycine hydroxymethyltransferase